MTKQVKESEVLGVLLEAITIADTPVRQRIAIDNYLRFKEAILKKDEEVNILNPYHYVDPLSIPLNNMPLINQPPVIYGGDTDEA